MGETLAKQQQAQQEAAQKQVEAHVAAAAAAVGAGGTQKLLEAAGSGPQALAALLAVGAVKSEPHDGGASMGPQAGKDQEAGPLELSASLQGLVEAAVAEARALVAQARRKRRDSGKAVVNANGAGGGEPGAAEEPAAGVSAHAGAEEDEAGAQLRELLSRCMCVLLTLQRVTAGGLSAAVAEAALERAMAEVQGSCAEPELYQRAVAVMHSLKARLLQALE
jgi:hypothetical protein